MPSSPDKLQPALLGGAFIGVLSALPFVSYVNACCCLWVLVGGLLAAWVMQQNHPYAITTADGALVGLLAGVFGALVATVVSLLMAPFQRQLDLYMWGRMSQMMRDVPPIVEQMMEQRRSGPAVNLIAAAAGLVMALIIYPIFALLGGLLGAALFRKSAPPPPFTAPVSPADLPPAP
ncbi:MAG: DUF5518 domain-containing protein [Acidobacteria bacterium]|nr:DUF5518 domain-containing protein [Acidobacteriota bacterium]